MGQPPVDMHHTVGVAGPRACVHTSPGAAGLLTLTAWVPRCWSAIAATWDRDKWWKLMWERAWMCANGQNARKWAIVEHVSVHAYYCCAYMLQAM